MTAIESWFLLAETTLATSVAVLLVLVMRRPVRHAFGAGAAYGLWAMVPMMLLAVLLPAAIEPTLSIQRVAAPMLDAITPSASSQGTGNDAFAWLPWAWGSGVMTMLAILGWQQHRFMAGLGPLRLRPDGLYQSLATRGLPAVVGWRPRIVLPGDFEQRYSAAECELVLAHEREHLRRGDLPACLVAALLCCLFWFNPLIQVAARCFRHDQELACDTGVLRRFPKHRHTYAKAMLKTQLGYQPLPVGCHWSGFHLIKERLTMLSHPSPSLPRRLGGLFTVAVLVASVAAAAWASQPGHPADVPPGKLLLELAVNVDEEPVRDIRAVVVPRVPHEERFEHEGRSWYTRWTAVQLDDGTFDLVAMLERDGEVLAQPRIVLRDEASIHIGTETEIGDFKGLSIYLRISAGAPAEP
jgi:beta-lactamase regulating signal transducer with metallopeptidase domain